MGKDRALQAAIIFTLALMIWPAKCFCGPVRSNVRGDTYAFSSRDYTVASAGEIESVSKRIGLSKSGLIIILAAAFAVILIFPFYFAVRELLRPRDLVPLNIDPKYTKDAMYFGNSFKELIFNAVGQDPPVGIIKALFSKYEKVSVNDALRITKGNTFRELLYIKKELNSEDNVTFEKEVYVAQNAHLGKGNTVRAIAAKGNIFIDENAKITRWAGADGNIRIGNNSILGARVACKGKLEVGRRCRFKYMAGNPIVTFSSGACSIESSALKALQNICDGAWCNSERTLSIPQGTKIKSDMIIKGDLLIGKGCEIAASIKTYGNVQIEDSVTVRGSIFANGNIYAGEHCVVMGDIYSLKEIYMASCTEVGSETEARSVISKSRLTLGRDVIIHGYCLNENTGLTI